MSEDHIQLSTNALMDYFDGNTQIQAVLQVTINTISKLYIVDQIKLFPLWNLKVVDNSHADEDSSLCYRITISERILSYSCRSTNGIVPNKTSIHQYSNARGQGVVFSFDLMDNTAKLLVTAFNNEYNKLHPTIHNGQMYILAKDIVKPVTRQYNKLSWNYEIIVTQETSINHSATENHINSSTSRRNFLRLCYISNQHTDAVIDNLYFQFIIIS
ncbi:unnamed protein product [Adineta steineri]|uniref:Uncharacterized protein n=1 Tax=Adineta steineri TaxID=433720 RepID=A0A815VAK8_9BILA|nr:unnamed protein product [Adineta steineri]CAF1654123.1 unnamed protein product [Adineta steineri]